MEARNQNVIVGKEIKKRKKRRKKKRLRCD